MKDVDRVMFLYDLAKGPLVSDEALRPLLRALVEAILRALDEREKECGCAGE